MTNVNDSNWIIYGANGYTGELIAREAVRQGLKPTLAGRNKAKVEALAQELGLGYKAFGLDNVDAVSEQLQGFKLVMHCAGTIFRDIETHDGSLYKGRCSLSRYYGRNLSI